MKWKPIQLFDGQWVAMPGFVGCCDCGLTHAYRYRLKVIKGNQLALQLQTVRHKAFTKQARAQKKFPFARRK